MSRASGWTRPIRWPGWKPRKQARLRAAVESRGEEVARIRFAEDGAGEFLDKAGMDEADLKYLESASESAVPAWKQRKKARSAEAAPDDSLESLIGGETPPEGVDTAALEESREPAPILMSEAGVAMANRLDHWNLRLTRMLLLLSIGLLALDYLRRANVYAEASLPLALPSTWLNAVSPPPPVFVRPDPPRRPMPDELAWMIRRGDPLVYLTDDPAAADESTSKLEFLTRKPGGMEILKLGAGCAIDDDFVFDALWFGRASFVVDSRERAERMLGRFVELLQLRKSTRARTRQTVHVVWDSSAAIPESTKRAFASLAGATGFTLFLNQTPQSP